MSHILLYSPQPAQREALLEQIHHLPYFEVSCAADEAALHHLLTTTPPDAILANLPDDQPPPACLAGFPCLMIGGQGEQDKLARPLRYSELEARLHLLLDRLAAESAFAVGAYTCHPLEHLLLTDDGAEQAKLTDKEVQLLRLLSQSAAPVSRPEILEKVWGYRHELETHTLETHIYRLRQKLEANPAAPAILLTVENGYTLA